MRLFLPRFKQLIVKDTQDARTLTYVITRLSKAVEYCVKVVQRRKHSNLYTVSLLIAQNRVWVLRY